MIVDNSLVGLIKRRKFSMLDQDTSGSNSIVKIGKRVPRNQVKKLISSELDRKNKRLGKVATLIDQLDEYIVVEEAGRSSNMEIFSGNRWSVYV